MRCIGVYFIEQSNQTLNNIGQLNINRSFQNLSKITPESFKDHTKMTKNDEKVSHVTPKRASSTRGSYFGAPKYRNGAKMEAPAVPRCPSLSLAVPRCPSQSLCVPRCPSLSLVVPRCLSLSLVVACTIRVLYLCNRHFLIVKLQS